MIYLDFELVKEKTRHSARDNKHMIAVSKLRTIKET